MGLPIIVKARVCRAIHKLAANGTRSVPATMTNYSVMRSTGGASGDSQHLNAVFQARRGLNRSSWSQTGDTDYGLKGDIHATLAVKNVQHRFTPMNGLRNRRLAQFAEYVEWIGGIQDRVWLANRAAS